MSVETHRVLMGTCGWKHQSWIKDYYSEDLPDDWYLGFYANEFPMVYVPAADWLDDSDMAEWTENVSDSFRFILEFSADVLSDDVRFTAALDKVKILNSLCLGLVFQVSRSICSDTELFEKRLKSAQILVPICVDSAAVTLTDEFKQLLLKYKTSEVWNGKGEVEPNRQENFQRGSFAITCISTTDFDMVSLRKVIEHSLSVSNDDCVSVLCFDGDPPSLELLRNADIILNLL